MTSTDRNTNSVADLRADRDEARRELGDTVEQLAAKADVKQHARNAVATTTGTAKRHSGAIAGTLAALVAAGTAAVVLLRRRHHQHTTLRARTVAHARKARSAAKSTLGAQRRRLAHKLH